MNSTGAARQDMPLYEDLVLRGDEVTRREAEAPGGELKAWAAWGLALGLGAAVGGWQASRPADAPGGGLGLRLAPGFPEAQEGGMAARGLPGNEGPVSSLELLARANPGAFQPPSSPAEPVPGFGAARGFSGMRSEIVRVKAEAPRRAGRTARVRRRP